MTMRQEFIDFFDYLVANCREEVTIPASVSAYVEAIRNGAAQDDKPKFTENGKMILKWLQAQGKGPIFKSKDIADSMVIAGKTVSGAMRKLVNDGYVEKLGKDPVIYTITDNGMNVNFDDEDNIEEN